MIDVHPPHASMHSWKDFWVHLGTITAGLLIAIGLEQSVEAVHRVHERHVLQHDLHAEAERNEQILTRDMDVLHRKSTYLVALRSNVNALRHGASCATLPPLPEPDNEDPFLPSAGAWASARDSSQLALLPREQASIYEELYAQRDFLVQTVLNWFRSSVELESFVSNAQAAEASNHLDPAKLTPEQQDQYAILLSHQITAMGSIIDSLSFYKAENAAVLRGVSNVDQLHQQVLSPDAPTPPSTIKSDSSPRKNP